MPLQYHSFLTPGSSLSILKNNQYPTGYLSVSFSRLGTLCAIIFISETESSYVLAESPDAYRDQGWVRPKLGAGNSTQVSQRGRDSIISANICCLSKCMLRRSWSQESGFEPRYSMLDIGVPHCSLTSKPNSMVDIKSFQLTLNFSGYNPIITKGSSVYWGLLRCLLRKSDQKSSTMVEPVLVRVTRSQTCVSKWLLFLESSTPLLSSAKPQLFVFG